MMDKDRNYYRMLGDDELIELAKTVKTNELALVLSERLREAGLKADTNNN